MLVLMTQSHEHVLHERMRAPHDHVTWPGGGEKCQDGVGGCPGHLRQHTEHTEQHTDCTGQPDEDPTTCVGPITEKAKVDELRTAQDAAPKPCSAQSIASGM